MLRVELTGSARVDVYRSKATGARITVGGAEVASVDANTPIVAEFEIGLDPFEDGGWIWFDITTDTKVILHKAGLVRTGARTRAAPTSRSASRPSTGRPTASTRCGR